MMENPIKMDDLGVPLFLETPKWCYFTLLINNDLLLRLVGVPLYASVVARVSLVVADEIVGETQPATEGGATVSGRRDQRNDLCILRRPKLGDAFFRLF